MWRSRGLSCEIAPDLGLVADLFALEATLIELSFLLFSLARWQKTHASLKLNVLLDVRSDMRVFAIFREANRHEGASLDGIFVCRE
jgi:hypothetical protein